MVQEVNESGNQQTPDPQPTDPQENSQAQLNTEPTTPVTTSAPGDLVSRGSEVLPVKPVQPIPDGGDILNDSGFNKGEWDKMLGEASPEHRQMLESAYNSLNRGAEKKFQTAAQMKRDAEAQLSQPWTQDRINQLMNDPEFVREAKGYANNQQVQQNPQDSGIPQEEWSALTDTEKAGFHKVQHDQAILNGKMNELVLKQEDEKLVQRYPTYNATSISELRQGLLNGQVKATSEHLHKVVDYEAHGERSYQLGMKDAQNGITAKQGASIGSSMGNGINTNQANEVPAKAENEGTVSYFRRLAQNRQKQMSQAGTQ